MSNLFLADKADDPSEVLTLLAVDVDSDHGSYNYYCKQENDYHDDEE